jgi:ADP-L-glycero-D-manno-heptose 6-epimerase
VKIFLTGTCGFIGKNLYKRLKETYEITTIDFKESDYDPFEFLNIFDKIVAEGDIIIHNGACSSTTETCPYKLNRLNFDYSQTLLKKCIDKNARLIYASSASVYGDGPFKESDVKKPKNLYALSKSMFDDYSQQFKDELTQIVGLRYFNVYGMHEEKKGDMASVVFKFFLQNKNKSKITLFDGSDNFFRDFIYIDDVINITMFFIKNPQYSGIYNCGTGIERSFQDIAKIFNKKYKCKIEYVEMPDYLKGKYQSYTKSNNKKIDTIYEKRRVSLEEGVEKYLGYLDENFH